MTGAAVTVGLTEAECFQALGNFLVFYCQAQTSFGLAPFTAQQVVRAVGATAVGSNVRVPEPAAGDFVVVSSLRYDRLEYNEPTFGDNICVGSIAGATLTVTSVARGTLAPGQLLTDYAYPDGNIQPDTAIVSQLSGATGGVGTYQVSVAQTLASETLYAGTRQDLVGTKWTVQLDVHGPNSANNAGTLATILRSERGVDFFSNQNPSIVPLYCDDERLLPFENAEEEVEWRWVMEACFEIGNVVTTPQMFFDEVVLETVNVQANYPYEPPSPEAPVGIVRVSAPPALPRGPILLDSTSGPLTYTLPAGPAIYVGYALAIKDVGGAVETNNITIATIDGSLIDGLPTFVFNQNYEEANFVWLGSSLGWGIF